MKPPRESQGGGKTYGREGGEGGLLHFLLQLWIACGRAAFFSFRRRDVCLESHGARALPLPSKDPALLPARLPIEHARMGTAATATATAAQVSAENAIEATRPASGDKETCDSHFFVEGPPPRHKRKDSLLGSPSKRGEMASE